MLCVTKKTVCLLVLLVAFLVGCRSGTAVKTLPDSSEVLALPTVTVPAGQQAEDVLYDKAVMAWITGEMQQSSNGMSVGIWPAHQNRYAERDTTYFMSQQDNFVAHALIGNGNSVAREIAVICLLDHLQIPCAPDLTLEHIITVPAKDFVFLPMELAGLPPGLHDLDILVVRDPYQDGRNPMGDDIRYFTQSAVQMSNILVDGLLAPPEIEVVRPDVAGQLERATIFAVSYGNKLVDEFGNFPIWIEAEGEAGTMLAFDLHFHADVHDEEGNTIAVMAFLNYEQVPLIYEEQSYQPLYVIRQAGTWQRAPVQIQLPDTPGTYELIMMARTDAFVAMEDGQGLNDVAGTETSRRIKITVTAP